MSEAAATAGLEGIVQAARAQAPGRGLPPVHLWHPAHCGAIDIVIKANGQWWHDGSPIGRPALVRLFSTILRRDPDGYVLVTPGEKLTITVEDAPFVATAVERRGGDLIFTTNVGDETRLDADNPLRIETDAATGEPRPYIHVRRGLEALITRPVFYELVEMATERPGAPPSTPALLGVVSAGQWFAIGAA